MSMFAFDWREKRDKVTQKPAVTFRWSQQGLYSILLLERQTAKVSVFEPMKPKQI